MGKGKLTAAILSVAIICGVSGAGFAKTAETGDKAVLSAMEQKLFFKNYPDEDQEARLARIEKRIFGDAVPGDFAQRLERVKAAVAPQINPDGTVTGGNQSTAGATPPPQTKPTQSAPDPQAEMERARIAVQAAKEEEVAKLLSEGVDLWRQKRGPQAIERFEQVLRLDQHNAEAHFNLGVVYESANNLAEASASYHKAAEENPNNRDYHDAVAAVEKKLSARKKTDDKAGELRVLAEDAAAAFKRQEYFSALDLYKQLDAKAPNKALVKYNIGTLYFMTKNYIDALSYYKQALKLEPKEARYQQAVQQLSANLKQGEEAQKQSDQQWAAYQASTGRPGLDGKAPKAPKQKKDKNNQQQSKPQQAYVPPQQGYPPQQGQYPPQQGQYPPQQGQYPPQQGQYPPQQAQYPPQQGQYPPQQAQYNQQRPPQGYSQGAQQNTDFLSSIGIIAKSGHEGLTINTIGIASRASKVGLQQGDLIKAIDGNIVKNVAEANQILSKKQQGAPVQLMIQRANQMGQFNL